MRGTGVFERDALRRHQMTERRVARQHQRAELDGRATFGDPAFRARRAQDLRSLRRASQEFGLVGGELCGCHEKNCATCLNNGGCGDTRCAPCSGALRRLRGKPWSAVRPDLGARLGLGEHNPKLGGGGPVVEDGGEELIRVPSVVGWVEWIVDMHAHNFTHSHDDSDDYLAGVSGTITEERIARLFDLNGYMDRSVMMGSFDGTVDDAITLSTDINAITAAAVATDPDHEYYFLPFYHVRTSEFASSVPFYDYDTKIDVKSGTFLGVGELFVHGHGEDFSYLTEPSTGQFLDIFVKAANNNRPVSVHWEIGYTTDATYTPSANFDDLEALLAAVEAAGPTWPLRLVICHCGLGPRPSVDEDIDKYEEWTAYQEYMQTLLDDHDNVYFDLSGLQIGRVPVDEADDPKQVWRLYTIAPDGSTAPTEVGKYLLSLMANYPERFILGTDVDNASDEDDGDRFGTTTAAESLRMYIGYLLMDYSSDSTPLTLTEAQITQIAIDNADVVLNG
jgi:Amidohydrolase